jgi:hemerythrin-like domain-containing protein
VTYHTEECDVARVIREQHAAIARMLAEVQAATGDSRRQCFERLLEALDAHETAEQALVYPVLRESGLVAAEVARMCAEDEDQAAGMVRQLERAGVDSDAFAPRFAVFRNLVTRHATREERTVLPLLEQTQRRAVLEQLAEDLRSAAATTGAQAAPSFAS